MAKMRLNWLRQEGVFAYDVVLNDARVRTDILPGDQPTVSVVLDGLLPGAYEVRVIAKDEAGNESLPSDPFTFNVYGRTWLPPAPLGLGAEQLSDRPGRVRAFWGNIPQGEEYDLFVNGMVALSAVPASAGETTDAELELPVGQHVLEVLGRDHVGNMSRKSDPVAIVVVAMDNPVPAPFLKGGVLNGRDVRLSWSGVPEASEYRLFLNDVLLVTVAPSGTPDEAYDLPGRPDGTYDFTIVAVTPRGVSARSNVTRLVIPG